MLTGELADHLIINLAALIIIANLLSHIHVFRKTILQEHRSVKQDFVLSLVFVALIVGSTSLEVNMGLYGFNTRMIGAMSAGLLGGPLVGFFASMLGGLYVLLTASPAVLAHSEAFSTVCFGLLGAGFYPYFQRGKWKYRDLILLAVFAELFEIFSLLRLTVSMKVAIEAIIEMSIPMMLINVVGLMVFIANFNYVFIQQDAETTRQLQRIGTVTGELMDLFENDRSYADNLSTFIDILMDNFDYSGVMITDRSKILHWRHPDIRLTVDEMTELSLIAVHAMNSGQLETMETPPEGSVWEAALNDNYSAAVPFAVNGQVRGSLVVWVKRTWFQKTIELEFIRIVHNLILFQLSKRELSKQLELTSQAELKALQFQVNPHFLFNALNTISFVCREDSERAVKLLRVLASYFRYSLKQRNFMAPLADEIQHVKDYLRIEEARFEEKLDIRFYEDTESDIPVPILILQPIIENAVRYGISADGYRHVTVRVSRLEGGVSVRIRDRGPGIPEAVLADIAADNDIDDHIGLTNVNRRLKAIYGNEGGLQITSDGDGTVIEIDFYGERQDEQGDR